jgi:membrane-associated phospholipid phosphatase
MQGYLTLTLLAAAIAAQGQVEPNGGKWKTWVLTSGSQFRLPPPPDAATTQGELGWLKSAQSTLNEVARSQVAYWDQGSASYHWVQYLQQRLLNQLNATPATINNPLAIRQFALLNVAIYDAMVAAWDNKYFYKRPLPTQIDPTFQPLVSNPHVPSYPNEFATAAGAAAAVLKYLYPADADALQGMAEEAARSRLYAGVAFPSDTDAGLKLGDEVGQLVVQRAKSDGSDALWTGTVPTGPGMWIGTNPVCPLCGNWKTWVLTSGDQFRSAPPPAYNSTAKQAELAALHAQPRTFYDQWKAFAYQAPANLVGWYDYIHTAIFEDHLTENALRSARAYALAAVAHYESLVACFDSKYAYWAIRPSQLDATLTTLFTNPNHPSYPSAHATLSTGITDVMAYVFPTRALPFGELAIEAGWSRMVAGIHYQSDIDSGNMLGHKVAQAVIRWANNDGSQ